LESDATQLPSAPVASEPFRPPAPGSFLRLGLFCLLALLALFAIVVASRHQPEPARRPFDERTLRHIRALRPDWVLIGNSLVNTRFNERVLNRALAPRRAAVLGVSGSKSAVWYLTLKNLVLAAARPRRVLIFFYGYELTSPRQRAMGAEHFQLARVSRDDEAVVARRLAPPPSQPVAHLSWRLSQLAPVERLHRRLDAPLDGFATHVSEWVQEEPDRAKRKSQINDLFALGNLRSVAAAPTPQVVEEGDDFERDVKNSLLPDMLELAASRRVPLTFIRIRTRELAEGGTLSAKETRYLQELEHYLHEHGAKYVDMAHEAWEDIGMYGEGSHISRRYTRQYTQLFVQHMSRVFE
jgi:hypothetical protein